jgi:glycerophosphoryl diester phosphodiesterase
MGQVEHEPLVIAHRGAAGQAPENTPAAFRLAVGQGCDMIELDVHLTADGEIVVCHDDRADRTTDGSGLLRDMTLEQIRRLDAGAWFSPAYAGERIPTLREVFELVPSDVGINIELKCGDNRIIRLLSALIREYGRTESVVISSFHHRLLHRLKTAAPNLRIGLIYSALLRDPVKLVRDFGLYVWSVHPHHALIEPEDIAALRANGQRVFPWTVNDPETMRRLLDLGVSGIITDHPDRLRRLVAHSGRREPAEWRKPNP